VMMPGLDGFEVLRRFRAERDTPVLMLTARTESESRIRGLNEGADDYLPKPFYVEELIARIQAVVRRVSGEQLTQLTADGLVVNLITRDVLRGEERIDLTAREFNLLELLMRSPGRVFTRTQILEHVWGYDFDPQTNVVDVYIRRLRAKIDVSSEPSRIETVRSVGYRFRRPEQGE